MKPCLIKHLRDSGCDTEKKLRDAMTVITGTLRANLGKNCKIPPFTFNNGYIYHG